MSDYTYGKDETTLHIGRMDSDAYVRVVNEENGSFYAVILPTTERQAAAQALAGDEWTVIATDTIDYLRDRIVQPEPIDPADVKVGDVVEVEATDGSWLVRGEVVAIDVYQRSHAFAVLIDGIKFVPHPPSITVRLVRRAEPEPDPEQVKALTEHVGKANLAAGPAPTSGDYAGWWNAMATELARNGVRVQPEER